mmetsp:Transcript_5854/g.12865  ORF Transcript_5854/g.12865 Transcript_5854/m.12865 type:complete len:668 (+) Transcript_5854:100-2103(+)
MAVFGITAAFTARMCAFLALPAVTSAPAVPPSEGDAAGRTPRYLRHAAADNRGGGGGRGGSSDSYLRSSVALPEERLSSKYYHDYISVGDASVGDEIDADDHRIDREALQHGVGPSRMDDDPVDDSGRRLQRSPEKWYVNWFESKCVQSCPPSAKNPHCAGLARWDQLLFDTAEYCCSVTMNWQPIEDCTDTGRSDDYMTSLTVNSNTNGGGGGLDENGCPPEYSPSNDYVSFDQATIYITKTLGHVYACKDGPLSQYCNVFPPNWSRTSYGGGSVHTTDSLGWKLLGDCEGNEVEEMEGSLLDGASPADSGTWPEGPPGPSPANLDGVNPADGGTWPEGPSPGDDGALLDNFPGLSVASPPAAAPSKPAGGRPDRPTRPDRPAQPKPSAQDGGPADFNGPVGSISFGSGGGVEGSLQGDENLDGAEVPPSAAGDEVVPEGNLNGVNPADSGSWPEDPASQGGGEDGTGADDASLSSNLPGLSVVPPDGDGASGPSNGEGDVDVIDHVRPRPDKIPRPDEPYHLISGKPARPKLPPEGDANAVGDDAAAGSTQTRPEAPDSIDGEEPTKPIPQEGQENGVDDVAGGGTRPKPEWPGKPERPYKPKPVAQVQQAPVPGGGEDDAGEGDIDAIDLIEKDEIACYRSGRLCDSDAEIFACCTQCIHGICI